MKRVRKSPRRAFAAAGLRRTVWGAVAAVVLVSVAALATTAARALRPSPAVVAQQEGSTSGGDPSTSTTVIPITVTRYGFEPREITLPAGEYMLLVRDYSGEPDLAVTARGLTRAADSPGTDAASDPGPPGDLPIPLGRGRRFLERVHLRPGTVTLHEAGRPGWRCRIDVAP